MHGGIVYDAMYICIFNLRYVRFLLRLYVDTGVMSMAAKYSYSRSGCDVQP